MGRSYDVDVTTNGPEKRYATADLGALEKDVARDLRKRLARLTDDDVHHFVDVPMPPGPEGRWVVLAYGGWRYVGQWNPGTPELWRLGAGRGRLLVHRIVASSWLEAALEDAARDA
ncbi:MAG TPA: hypothetical protein VF587_20285 [Solirubrobacteraceae bacterium]